jgi:GTPase SAR1 family protein
MVNIVIFGAMGAGKSSVINLMAGRQVARTSPDKERCTLRWKEYTIIFDNGTRYQVFDTVGLQEPRPESGEYLTAITDADNLIDALKKRGGINLLLFCVRVGRFAATMQSNYRLFFEIFCQEKVPLVLVVTGLERERGDMEDWYTRNGGIFEVYDIHSVSHVCITAATAIDGRHRVRYEESRRSVRSVVEAHYLAEGWTGGRFTSLLGIVARSSGLLKKRDIVWVLTTRCGIPLEAALQLAQQTRYERFSRDELDPRPLRYRNDTVLDHPQSDFPAPMSKIQVVTQQETQPESPTPSYLNVLSTLTLHSSPYSHRTIRSMLQTL